jgi:hypothetical protein
MPNGIGEKKKPLLIIVEFLPKMKLSITNLISACINSRGRITPRESGGPKIAPVVRGAFFPTTKGKSPFVWKAKIWKEESEGIRSMDALSKEGYETQFD